MKFGKKKVSCLKNKIFSDIGKGDILIWGARLRTEAANHQRAAKYKDAGQCRDSLNVDNRHALAKVFNGGRLGTCPIGQTHHVEERGQQKNEVKEGIRIDDAFLFIPNHLLAVVLRSWVLSKTAFMSELESGEFERSLIDMHLVTNLVKWGK